VVGDGPVDIVLAQGWVTHLDLAWDVPPLARFLQRLASFSRLILFDKRGTGLSERYHPGSVATSEERLDDLLGVMDAAGSERAVLIGTLWEGATCGLAAVAHPERVTALALYGSFARADSGTGLMAALAPVESAALDRVEREWGTVGVGAAMWAPTLADDEDVVRAYLRMLRAGASPGTARAILEAGWKVRWDDVLPRIRVPTIVLHRTGDPVVPVALGRGLASGIPGASFVELPGDDHLMWAGHPEPVVEELMALLAASSALTS
jgi:pimeloyl-ACP methyl ester carboxylesterase